MRKGRAVQKKCSYAGIDYYKPAETGVQFACNVALVKILY